MYLWLLDLKITRLCRTDLRSDVIITYVVGVYDIGDTSDISWLYCIFNKSILQKSTIQYFKGGTIQFLSIVCAYDMLCTGSSSFLNHLGSSIIRFQITNDNISENEKHSYLILHHS